MVLMMDKLAIAIDNGICVDIVKAFEGWVRYMIYFLTNYAVLKSAECT